MRVISLLPSATEMLCAIGGEHLLVGRSHECDFPPSTRNLPSLTRQRTTPGSSAEIDAQVRAMLNPHDPQPAAASLYELDGAHLASLKPDLILTQDLCRVCSIDLNTVRAVAATISPAPDILSLNPVSLEDVFDDLLRIGRATSLLQAAEATVVRLRERFWSARDFVNPYIEGPEIGFLEWMDPPFAGGHWTPQLIVDAGGRHSLNEARAASRQITPEDLLAAGPERLIICPCGFDLDAIVRDLPALTSQRWWKLIPAVQQNQVALVDGNQMFNRPGPRLVDAFCWLVGWINDRPEVMPMEFPWRGYSSRSAAG